MNMSKFVKSRSPIFPNNGLQFCSIYASSRCSWSWFVHLCFEGMSRFIVASRVYLVTWLCLDSNNSGWWGSAGSWGGRKASKLKSAGGILQPFPKVYPCRSYVPKKGVTTVATKSSKLLEDDDTPKRFNSITKLSKWNHLQFDWCFRKMLSEFSTTYIP